MNARGSVWREGITAGILGAVGVAVWIFAVDTIESHPFYTPALLGKGVLSVLGRGIENHSDAFFVVAYTFLHAAAFIGVGCIASKLLTSIGRAPQFTAALALFFAVFEVGFYFLAKMLSSTDVLGALSWYQIGAANLVASILMGGYLLRRHPEFRSNLAHALDGST
jgi:hypothetical protein